MKFVFLGAIRSASQMISYEVIYWSKYSDKYY
ncbi:NADH-quinone oxidoreductase subunit H [Ehrlichia ruminantium]|nr:NADH-quinone oxidoreductase subunit H [Ehrlichia ruminantium]QLK51912.1 NADH-quinone oxidoreductase subunit H [Ehrlichia ruminantium]QLK53752.1 NADH-quinone oxidoreductase subunit H [Ehrlichia ruminantium]QLK59246.1 NADH-quinone oxidoreductase subunit H [Ehrlichia ruminantium]